MVTPNETIDHVTLERLIEAGAVRGASIIGQPGGWRVVIQCGMTERALAAKRGAVRIFRKFESLVGYLKGIGIATYQVEATGFDPMPRKTGTREGAATRMKHAHEAVAYDTWFREQAQSALDDPRPSIPHAEVKAHFATRRAALRKHIAAKLETRS